MTCNGILFGHCLSKHKMTTHARNLGGMVPLPPWLRLWLQEKNEKERIVLTWCSIFQTKISQQRKRASHGRTPMKINIVIVSIGSYVWLFCCQLDCLQTEIACWNCKRECYFNQLEQFVVSFTWKNVSTLGLLHMVSWGCCDNTSLCKTCLHAVCHQSRAAMSNPRPVGRMRPTLGFRCSESILHTDNLPLF